MNEMKMRSDSLESTNRLGYQLAAALKRSMPFTSPIVICLDGNLGAGKTTFATALCKGLGVAPEDISSPTFSLQNVYRLEWNDRELFINHFDFYRINDEDELFETGFEETISFPTIHIVEWSNRFLDVLPENRLAIRILSQNENQREFQFSNSIPGLNELSKEM